MSQSKVYPITNPGSTAAIDHVPVAAFHSAKQAMPSGRLLEGSDDHGFDEEWIERGTLDGWGEAEAVYLFTADQISDEPENYPWDAALTRFRLLP